MRSMLFTFVLLSLVPVSSTLAGVHVGLAQVDEIEGVTSKAATLSWETDQRHPWEFMGGVIKARNDARLSSPRVIFGSVSKRFTWHGWFAHGGIAATNSDTEELSRHWQFMTGIGYRYQRLTVSVRHLSNANTGGRNRGENLFLLQFGF